MILHVCDKYQTHVLTYLIISSLLLVWCTFLIVYYKYGGLFSLYTTSMVDFSHWITLVWWLFLLHNTSMVYFSHRIKLVSYYDAHFSLNNASMVHFSHCIILVLCAFFNKEAWTVCKLVASKHVKAGHCRTIHEMPFKMVFRWWADRDCMLSVWIWLRSMYF